MFAYCGNNPVSFMDTAGTFYTAALQQTRDGVFRESGTADKYTKADEIRERRQAVKDFFNNEDEDKVIQATVAAFYKGHLVIKVPGNSSFSFGVIFFGNDCNAKLLRHEYGHTVQLEELGVSDYCKYVVAPSVSAFWLTEFEILHRNNYNSYPWEYQANQYGNADFPYQPWAPNLSEVYWDAVRVLRDK